MAAMSKLSLSPFAPPSPTLAHFNRLAATSSGQDKLFMIYAYAQHVIVALLRSRAFANKRNLDLANRLSKLGSIIGDARVLYRLFGLFPIISWLQSLNSPLTAPSDATLTLLERLQGWSMLLYYPMEHAYYLAGKGVFDLSAHAVNTLAIWSCRFWAAYVVLQLLHLRRQYQLWQKERATLRLRRSETLKSDSVTTLDVEEEKREIARLQLKATAMKDDLMVQLGYLPLTVHWSMPNGILPSNVWVGACGTLAAAFGLKMVWRGTA